jgi:hypothetical protein
MKKKKTLVEDQNLRRMMIMATFSSTHRLHSAIFNTLQIISKNQIVVIGKKFIHPSVWNGDGEPSPPFRIVSELN